MIIKGTIGNNVSTSNSPTLQLAKSELIKYFKYKCGDVEQNNIEVIFTVNNSLNSFYIEVNENKLLFVGKNEIEILYSVYEFSEKILGFLFFEPGEDTFPAKGEVELSDGIIVADKEYKLKRRGFIQEFDFNDETTILFDWMAKRRMNYLLTWMKYYDNLDSKIKEYAQIRGIEIESGHHNFNYWIPGKKYASTNPEFFAEINGERIKPSVNADALLLSEQLCTTNPQLRNELMKNMLSYYENNPEIKTVSLIPNDGFGWCECKECAKFYDKNIKGEKYNVSQHVYKADKIYHNLIDDVANKLHEIKPDLNLSFCAYVNYSAPAEGFKLKKNTSVHFAPYWRCINHALNDPNCEINSQYTRDLKSWINASEGGEINIYEYYMGVNLYVSLPMLHFEEMFEEMEFYYQQKVAGVLTQFHLPNWRAYGFNYCLLSKAANGEDFTTSYNEIMSKLFAENQQQVKYFYKKIKKLIKSVGSCHIPYPYSLFSRTKECDYQEIYNLALEISQNIHSKIWQETLLWSEYLLKFKQLFDNYHKNKVTVNDVEDFRNWIHNYCKGRIVVHSKVDMLLNAWIEAIKQNKKWFHFNLEWEDEYIKTHANI